MCGSGFVCVEERDRMCVCVCVCTRVLRITAELVIDKEEHPSRRSCLGQNRPRSLVTLRWWWFCSVSVLLLVVIDLSHMLFAVSGIFVVRYVLLLLLPMIDQVFCH